MVILSSLGGTIPLPWLWFLLAIIFAIVEALTLGIISIWFAIGALVAMISSIFVDSLLFQVLTFPYVPGEIKLDGKFWRAVSESKQTYLEGAIVTVLRIEGVTVIVK